MESRRLFESGAGRIRWVGLPIALLFLVVGMRLFDLQILHGADYETMARENRVRIRLVQPLRGRILDAAGRVLAEDRPRWGVAVNFHELVPPEEIANRVARWWRKDPHEVGREIGSGWGDEYAPQVREIRREALLASLEDLSRILHRPFEELVEGVLRAEENVLQREMRERVRVVGLLLSDGSLTRSEVRKEMRKVEAEILEATWDTVPEGEFLLASGFRWELEWEARRKRRRAVEALASKADVRRRDLPRRLRDLDRGCARRIVASMRAGDHVLVEGELDYGAVARLEMDGEDFPGVSVQVHAGRRYPQGVDACHVVGYVGYLGWTVQEGDPVNLYEVKEAEGFYWDPLSTFLDRDSYERMEKKGEFHRDLFGKTGVERTWDGELRGCRGARIVERDRRNRVQRNLRVHPAAHGSTLSLTVDSELQAAVRGAFQRARLGLRPGWEIRGAAVVLDVNTGAVLAMVSVPGFDPNDLIPPVSRAVVKKYLLSEGKPLFNRAVAGQYPPGSTFKVVSALASLEEKLVDAEEKIDCTGSYEYGRHVFRCWDTAGHGPLGLEEALERSCNVYFYTLGRELGDSLRRWAEVWGFGSPTGLDVVGEKGGSLPPGRGGDWVQQAIGQRMTATPLQVARLMAIVANGGRFVVPFLRKGGGVHPEGQVPVVSPKALKKVRLGLVRVVHGEHGTAKRESLAAVKAAGKTGTAETGRLHKGEPVNDAWFAGYAPYHDPKVAVAVVIESVHENAHGGEVAGPVAEEIFEAALARWKR
ncbi:MAG: peptidoglycan D,D-transpeptidase FtsI family protein [Planctomycetota bacterium]|jgi:penicillin-binding protein 2